MPTTSVIKLVSPLFAYEYETNVGFKYTKLKNKQLQIRTNFMVLLLFNHF